MLSIKLLLFTSLVQQILGRLNIDPLFGMPKAEADDYNITSFD